MAANALKSLLANIANPPSHAMASQRKTHAGCDDFALAGVGSVFNNSKNGF